MIALLALPSAHEINKQLPALHFTKYRRGSCASAYHGNVLGKSQMLLRSGSSSALALWFCPPTQLTGMAAQDA